jgi:hypothetical protein
MPAVRPDENTSGRALTRWRRPLVIGGVVVVLLLAAGIETLRLLNDPGVYFLRGEDAAEWIRLDQEFSLNAYSSSPTGLFFEYPFRTADVVWGARLTVRAFHRRVVKLDSETIYVGPQDQSGIWSAGRLERMKTLFANHASWRQSAGA